MKEREIKYQVNDRPAERGINMTNMLLSLLILLGGIFGTVMTNFMGTINSSVQSMDKSIASIQIVTSVTTNDVEHIKGKVGENSDKISAISNFINELDRRISREENSKHLSTND